jgi:hypothetical protein
VIGGGAILGGLVLCAIGVFVIDRAFVKAAAFAVVGAVLTFFGFMHGEAIRVAQSPLVAVRYLGIAGLLFGCAKLRRQFPSSAARCPICTKRLPVRRIERSWSTPSRLFSLTVKLRSTVEGERCRDPSYWRRKCLAN